jgi:hypothetical protein
MKKLPKITGILLILIVCATLTVPAEASAAVASKVLINGDVYTPGIYKLDLDLTGKSKYIEFRVVNGDGNVSTLVSSVKITMNQGDEKIVIISPDEFSKRMVSTAVGTLGEEVLNGMGSISVDLRVGGPDRYRNMNSNSNVKIKEVAQTKGRLRAGVVRARGVQLFITEYYENVTSWPPRPAGW